MTQRSRGLILAVTTIIALLLASCSTTTSNTGAPETANKDTKPYGSLTIALNMSQGMPDPQVTSYVWFRSNSVAVFDSLLSLTRDAQVAPGLAERWELAKDGLSQTFYIRKGVKFHNGDDLTGADVKFSIERMIAPEATHQNSSVLRGRIAGVDLKDDYTVVVRWKTPVFELLGGFTVLGGADAVLPKKYIEEKGVEYFRKNPIGSGPFRVVKWEPGGLQVELEANENYWDSARVPKFKNITLLNATEQTTIVAMLKTGELDAAIVSPDSAVALKSAGLRILRHDGNSAAVVFLFYDLDNPEKYPLGSQKVRQALSLAIDRKEMADKLFAGYAEPSSLYQAPKTAFFYDPNVLKPDPFDPERAKKLVAEAGYANGFDLKLWDHSANGQLMQALAGYFRKIGANLTLEVIEYSTLIQLTRPLNNPPMRNTLFGSITQGGNFQFEGMTSVYSYSKGSLKNNNNPKLDELIDKVPLTTDPAEKKRLALEAAVMVRNDYAVIPILDFLTPIAIGQKIGEVKPIQNIVSLVPVLERITHPK